MSEFSKLTNNDVQVGAILQCIRSGSYKITEGKMYTVLSKQRDLVTIVVDDGEERSMWTRRFTLDESKMHRHHDCIVAWAKGATIEFKTTSGEWRDTEGNPGWYSSSFYRVQPVDPNASEIARIEKELRVLTDDLAKLK